MQITRGLAAAALLLAAGSAGALTDAEKCQSSELKTSGKYGFCRLKADAKAVKTATTPDYSKCDSTFSDKFGKADTDGMGQCPSSASQAQIQAYITQCSDDVATVLGGGVVPTCGDNAVNVAGEACDGADLGGETCASLGFAGGTLTCSSCSFDVSGCSGCTAVSALPATGQTTAYGTGSDGDLQKGATRSFTDNGDGTITDNVTGLMWEKKSDDGSIHDWEDAYTWWGGVSGGYLMDGTMVTTFLAALNGGGGFAGYTDWRIPNANELESIRNLQAVFPATYPAFNTGCAASCTVTSCSCTQSSYYWSSTTYQNPPNLAWNVYFGGGYLGLGSKSYDYYVRAVRGGS